MNPIQYLRMLWARRTIVIVTLFVCVAAALLIIKILPTRYAATTGVMLDIIKPDPVSGEQIGVQYAKVYVNAQTSVIRDYRTAGKVVDAFGWTSSPELAEEYEQRPSDDKRDFRRWLAQRVIDNTEVNLVEGSNILEITYYSTSPDVARRGADAIAQAYVDQAIAFKRENAARNAQWFSEQTQKVKKELAAAEKRKSDFEQENDIILQADNTDTETKKLEAMASQATMPAMQAAMAGGPVNAPSSGQLAQLDAQISAAARTLGPNHPDLVALRSQREVVAQTVQRELAAASASRIMPTGPNMKSLIDAQTQKVLAKRGLVNEAQRLATDVSVLQQQFLKTAERAAELRQLAQSTEAGVTRLGNALAPEDPVWPNKPLIFGGGIIAGLLVGIALAFGVELLHRRVRGVEDLEFEGVPVLGVMPPDPDNVRPRDFWYWLGLSRAPWKRATT